MCGGADLGIAALRVGAGVIGQPAVERAEIVLTRVNALVVACLGNAGHHQAEPDDRDTRGHEQIGAETETGAVVRAFARRRFARGP